jgi:hypothetical protein
MVLRLLLLGIACIGATCARAQAPDPGLAVVGRFTGIAHAHTPGGGGPWDGATVNGTFDLRVPRGPWWDAGSAFAPPSGRFTFELAGTRFSFDAGPGLADAPGHVSVGGPPGQSISFLTDPRPRDHGAIVTFGSAQGGLYRDDDFAGTLAIDRHTVSWMTASFADRVRALDVVVDVRSFAFGGVSSPAPEPHALALLALGLAVVPVARRAARVSAR